MADPSSGGGSDDAPPPVPPPPPPPQPAALAEGAAATVNSASGTSSPNLSLLGGINDTDDEMMSLFDASLVETLFLNEMMAFGSATSGGGSGSEDGSMGPDTFAGLLGGSIATPPPPGPASIDGIGTAAEAGGRLGLGLEGQAASYQSTDMPGAAGDISPLPSSVSAMPHDELVPLRPNTASVAGKAYTGMAAAAIPGSGSIGVGASSLPPPPMMAPPAASSPSSIPFDQSQSQPQPQPQTQTQTQTQPGPAHQQKARQLVNQFATLADRLGISLPPNVLSSLTVAAAANEAKSTSTGAGAGGAGASSQQGLTQGQDQDENEAGTAAASGTAAPQRPMPSSSSLTAEASAATAATKPSFAQQLERTAEESIAAIEERRRRGEKNNKRKFRPQQPVATTSSSSVGGGGGGGVVSMPTPATATSSSGIAAADMTTSAASATTAATAASAKTAASSSAQYRRKKKPRLSDCETRLEQLRSENGTLKRHLANITDKTALIDREREQAEKKLSEMVRGGATEEQIGPVLERFGEMYSDYGRRRHEELTFHLEQLQRLAAPTTITKMTLWTCGQSDQFFYKPKSNPIAGILMKELDITPAQGRKIIERRDTIRTINENIRQCLLLMTKLQSLCRHKQKVFHARMTKCQEILSPLQVAKLLVWVDDHADTLESVCPGWGSERISKRSASSSKASAAAAAAAAVGVDAGPAAGGSSNVASDAGSVPSAAGSDASGEESPL